MTIDERIEALTMNLELLYRDSEAQNAAQNKKIEALLAAVQQDAENIRSLARIAEVHERRTN